MYFTPPMIKARALAPRSGAAGLDHHWLSGGITLV